MEVPALCVNNCGFYGSMESRNMCYKCYGDFLRQEQESLLSRFSKITLLDLNEEETATSTKLQPCEEGCGEFDDRENQDPFVFQESTVGGNSSSSSSSCSSATKKRCRVCYKKLGLLGFDCRCGFEFCGSHRYPEVHSCSADLKADLLGKFSIKIMGEVCKADKMKNRI